MTQAIPPISASGSEPGTAPSSDDELRRLAAARLAEHLDTGASLIQRCENLALTSKRDKLGPIDAAARLMRANAQVAQALANLAQVERRQRSIVERIQPPDPKKAELISKLKEEGEGAKVRLSVWKRMNELVEQSIRARSGDTSVRDRVAMGMEHEEEVIARVKRDLGEAPG